MAPPTLLEQWTGVSFTDPAQAAFLGVAFALVIGFIQAAFKITAALLEAAAERRSRLGRRRVRPDMVATLLGAGLILALSIEGMWRFFGAIHMPVWGRIAFAAVFEICLLAVALRARHIRLLRQARRDLLTTERDQAEDPTDLDEQIDAIRLRGINDLLVWVFAAVIGTLAALEAPTEPEQVARFIVPFIAAGMWELALGADVEDQRVSAAAKGWSAKAKAAAAAAGRWFVSVAIHFGWTPPTSANATTKFREKLMTKLVAVSHQIHTTAGDVKDKELKEQRELILDLQARGQWDEDTMSELGERLDALYRAYELTAPATVRPEVPVPSVAAPAAPELPAQEFLPQPALPAAPVLSRPSAPERKPRRRPGTGRLDPAVVAEVYKDLRVDLGRAPTVSELASAAPVVNGQPLFRRSAAGKWMQQHAAATDAALELEGASV